MAIYVDPFKCCLCKAEKLVVHTGKPTIANFHDSELLKDCDGKDKHVCYTCESDRMSDDED